MNEAIARRCDELLNTAVAIAWPDVIEQVKVEFGISNSQYIEDCYNEWIDGE